MILSCKDLVTEVIFFLRSYAFVRCDVREWKDQLEVFKSAVSNSPHHSVDIVIANAGISGDDHFYQIGTF